MIQEPFADGSSAVHRTSPALRVVTAVLFSTTAALIYEPAPLIIALTFSIILAILARLPAKPLLKRLAAAGGLLLMIWLLVPWTYPGDPIFSVGPITVTHAGVRLCLQITSKMLTILIAFSALIATMHLSTLGHTLHRLGVPSKLVHLLLLAYRYIFVIEQEYQRLYRAARMRNFRPGSNLHTYRTFAYLLGMLFVRASERAARVHQAMKCRGFDGRFYSLDQFNGTTWNLVLAVGVATISVLLIGLETFAN
jgi:cobalt/nickel transport system permease protein